MMRNFILVIAFCLTNSLSSVKANLAYITNEKDNTVSVIDIKKKKSSIQSKLVKDPEE